MATPAFEELVETFEFLDDWEDRYRHVIEMGKAFSAMDEALKVPTLKVEGCASQVWLVPQLENERFTFQGASDAMIVQGLIAVLYDLYNGLALSDVKNVNAKEELARLGLDEHLSSQRSNGLRAMITRLHESAQNLAN